MSVYNIRVFRYLQGHGNPHIPEIHCFAEEGERLTVIEELIRGQTLDFVLRTRKLTKKDKLRMLEGISEGLIFLHSAKPMPIMCEL